MVGGARTLCRILANVRGCTVRPMLPTCPPTPPSLNLMGIELADTTASTTAQLRIARNTGIYSELASMHRPFQLKSRSSVRELDLCQHNRGWGPMVPLCAPPPNVASEFGATAELLALATAVMLGLLQRRAHADAAARRVASSAGTAANCSHGGPSSAARLARVMAEIILVALLRAPCCLPMVGILRVRGARDQKQGERDRGRRHHRRGRNSFVCLVSVSSPLAFFHLVSASVAAGAPALLRRSPCPCCRGRGPPHRQADGHGWTGAASALLALHLQPMHRRRCCASRQSTWWSKHSVRA
eukprot:scaffold21627_cov71-Phaeocystis_antarctica.AAC.3